jgi:hypothetical protein
MKLRIERSMLDRARACADAAGLTLSEWARRVLVKFRRGDLAGVAEPEIKGTATRKNSTVISIPGVPDAEYMRAALYAGIAFCEARRPPPFKTNLREGVDYIVEVES